MRSAPPLLALTIGLFGCGGSTEPPAAPQLVAPAILSIVVSPPPPQLAVGASATLGVVVRDAKGAFVTGRTLAWSSANTAVVTVDGGGTIVAIAPGSALVSASLEGKTGSTQVTVAAPLVATVAIVPPAAPIVAGQASTLAVVVSGQAGEPLAGRRVTWSSSSPEVAAVDASGSLTALSPGTTTITALCEGVRGSFVLVVAAPAGSAPPTIASITPATLAPGGSITITGANFLAAGNNRIAVAGVPVTVTSATATQLTAALPMTDLPCQSAQSVSVTVGTIGGIDSATHPLAVATPRTLAVGASFIAGASGGGIACNELTAGGRYLVSVFNASASSTTTSRFELRGSAGAPGMVATRAPVADLSLAPAVSGSLARAPSARATTQEREHLGRVEEDLALLARLGAPRRAAGPPRGPSFSRAAVPQVPMTLGARTTINYHYNSCTTTGITPVTARVVYVGPKTIVLEDVAGPLAGMIDADLTALAQEFETRSYPLLLDFGDPLAFDAQTDGNGRLVVLFTPRVNAQSQNLLGFVAGCDLYPPGQDPAVAASNQAEIFYARTVTDTSPTSTALSGRAQWRRQMPATMVHEAKHIVSYAERLSRRAARFEQAWLEEATAQAASELYGRAIHGNGWRTDATYDPTLFCESRPATPSCEGGVIAMGNHFAFLTNYLRNFENKSILSGSDDSDIYGSAWLFVRWAADTYGGAVEGRFFRALVQSATHTGTANIEAATGRPFAQLLAEFSLMLAADNLPNVGAPFVEPSWNLPDVFAGYAELDDRPSEPLAMRTSTGGAFSVSSRNLKGGGAVLLRLDAAGASQLLDLRSSLRTALPATSPIGMAVLRVE